MFLMMRILSSFLTASIRLTSFSYKVSFTRFLSTKLDIFLLGNMKGIITQGMTLRIVFFILKLPTEHWQKSETPFQWIIAHESSFTAHTIPEWVKCGNRQNPLTLSLAAAAVLNRCCCCCNRPRWCSEKRKLNKPPLSSSPSLTLYYVHALLLGSQVMFVKEKKKSSFGNLWRQHGRTLRCYSYETRHLPRKKTKLLYHVWEQDYFWIKNTDWNYMKVFFPLISLGGVRPYCKKIQLLFLLI